MARPRSFDEDDVVRKAAEVFCRLGYNASSVDDLVAATGLQRGSLYKAFGSKRNLFERVLAGALREGWERDASAIDLVITALRELAPIDEPIAALCRSALAAYGKDAPLLLGARLLDNLTVKE